MPTAIVYGIQSGIVHQIVVSDESNYDFSQHVPSDDYALTVVPDIAVRMATGKPVLNDANTVVSTLLGREPEPARCLVIDTSGDVVNVVMADPYIDRIDGHTIVQSDTGDIGHVPDADGNWGPLA